MDSGGFGMQTALFLIWTRIVESIANDDDR